MQTMILIFLLLSILGAVFGHLGGAIIALGMAAFLRWAQGIFKQQEVDWQNQPQQAHAPKESNTLLAEREQQAGASRF